MPSVFLSHSSNDKFFVRKLAEKLTASNVKVWIDEAELKVGDSLVGKISGAIQQADFVAAILSHSSIQSEWVTKELHLAVTQEIKGRRVKVLPILIEPCEIPGFLSDKFYADFTNPDDFDRPMSTLLRTLGVEVNPSAQRENQWPSTSHVKQEPTLTSIQEEYTDILLEGIDKVRTYQPNPTKNLYHVYFKLSDYPTREWSQIFEAERRFPRHQMWRKAWLDGRFVVVHCAPEEVKKYHLNDIQVDIANCNVKYREYLQSIENARAQDAKRCHKLKLDLDEALSGIDID